MNYKFLFIILIFSLITSCVKDYPIEPKPLPPPPKGQPTTLPAKPYRTVFVSDSLKSYGEFKVGSYWIFRDSITSLADSVYVNSITSYFTTLNYTIDSNIVVEQIQINCHGDPIFSHVLCSYPKDIIVSTKFTSVDCSIFLLDTLATTYDIVKNKSLNSLPIFGNTFYNTRLISYAHSFYGHSTGIIWVFGDVYWKKNIGIIKYHNYPTSPLYHPYELIRYNVIQ